MFFQRLSKCGRSLVEGGEKDSAVILKEMKSIIENEPLARIDYVEIVDMNTMKNIDKVKGDVTSCYGCIYRKTRLIDNFIYYAD